MEEKKPNNFKRLMNYAGNYKYFTYVALLLSAISAVLALVPFIYIWKIIKEVLDVAPNFKDATMIIHNGWMAVIFAVVSMLIYFAGLMCSHTSAFRVAGNIKIKLMKHITKMPIGKLDDFGSGKLRKIVTESSSATETYLAHNLPDMVTATITPLVMVIFLFVFDWRFGIASLIPFALGFFAMSKMTGKQMQKDMKLYQDSLEDMNNEAVEYVRGVPIVKTFSQTIFSFKKFKKAIDNYSKFCIAYSEKCRKPMLKFQVYINSVFVFLILLTLILIGGEPINNSLFLNILFYIILTPIIATSLNKVMFMSENNMLINDAISRIDNLLNCEPLKESKVNETSGNNQIELKNVKFKYDDNDNYAINNISLKVPQNSIIALVGPSGSGKSTIANLISRFYDVTSGEILIGGINIKNISEKELMDNISFVFQNSKLLKATILDNIRMGKPTATYEEVEEAVKKAGCQDIIDKLPAGLNTKIGSDGIFFSGGEVQRIGIARAILKDAPILILDEATAFADPDNESRVQKAFEELSKNKTVIMIAHRISTVKNADRIYLIKNGQIAEEGNHNDLMKKEKLYYKMWNDYQTSIAWKVGVNND